MVVDKKNRFVTGRQQPKLVLIKVGIVPSTGSVQFFAFGQAGRLIVKVPDKADPSNVVLTEVRKKFARLFFYFLKENTIAKTISGSWSTVQRL